MREARLFLRFPLLKEVIDITEFVESKTFLDQQIEKYEKLMKLNPDDVSIIMAYAESNLRRGKKLAALQAYQKVASIKAGVKEVHLALAKIYASLDMLKEAVGEIEKVIEIAPGNIEAYLIFKEITTKGPLPFELPKSFALYENFQPSFEEASFYLKELELEKEKIQRQVRELRDLISKDRQDIVSEYNLQMALQRHQGVSSSIDALRSIAGRELDAGMAAKKLQERKKNIEAVKEKLEEILDPLARTKGVTNVFVQASDKFLITEISKTKINLEKVSELVVSASKGINYWKTELKTANPVYWVIEFIRGLLVMQFVNDNYLLVVVGELGTNWGALRYTMDRVKPNLSEILSVIPLP